MGEVIAWPVNGRDIEKDREVGKTLSVIGTRKSRAWSTSLMRLQPPGKLPSWPSHHSGRVLVFWLYGNNTLQQTAMPLLRVARDNPGVTLHNLVAEISRS
jgi:hypothetical protein